MSSKLKYIIYGLLTLNIILVCINLYGISIFINPSSEKLISITDVRGKDISSATKILIENGFKPRIQGILINKDKDNFIVIDQNPLTKGLSGSIVDLWINQQAKLVKIPDLRYKSVEEARNLLEKLGLRMESLPYEDGIIVRQIPDPDIFIEFGSNVLVIVENENTETLTIEEGR
jgi:beta-lactam-binding protein with PASTA domain